MKKSWDAKKVEIIPMRISAENYDQLLDETAEFVYRYFCQLLEIKLEASVTNTEISVDRTGTDG